MIAYCVSVKGPSTKHLRIVERFGVRSGPRPHMGLNWFRKDVLSMEENHRALTPEEIKELRHRNPECYPPYLD